MEKNNKRNFKTGVKLNECRRSREDSSIRLRKGKREEGLAKKRNILRNNLVGETNDEKQGIDETKDSSAEAEAGDMSELFKGLASSDVSVLINSTRGFRRYVPH